MQPKQPDSYAAALYIPETTGHHSTVPLTYGKEVFDLLYLLYLKDPAESFIESRDDGVFIEISGDRTLDWTPSCELVKPGSPDPLTTPLLPLPFSANHLAAFMLNGWGYFMQQACGDWATGPDEAILQCVPVQGGKVKEVLRGAYAAYRDAEMVVEKLDKKTQSKTQKLEVQYREKERQASVQENFRERGISKDEYRQRHARYKASIAKPLTRMEESRRQSDEALSAWRKAMVNQLLRPQATGMAGEQPPAVPVVTESASAGVETAKAGLMDKKWVMKKSALIDKHIHQWPTIKRDFQDASENGLSKAAKAPLHGEWYEAAALDWARQRGKLTEEKQQASASLATVWIGTKDAIEG